LFAEAVRFGLIEEFMSSYRICIAGPSTMGALLNSLQAGFRTLAIQKRSGEVWAALGQVKGEFEKFSEGLDKIKRHLELAGKELDTLSGTRTRALLRTLSKAESDDNANPLT
jgi:DNA recombination protein RmuC